MFGRVSIGLIATLIATHSASAQFFTDNFNDGNDDGWTRLDPLAEVGASPAQYSFPGGGYRIQAGSSPDPNRFNVSRAGSYRPELQYADFVARVDIVDWDDSLPQGFALTARTSDIGLLQSDGYLATVQTDDFLVITRFTDEWSRVLAYAPCQIEPGRKYRLKFSGKGDELVASVYDLANPGTPISTVVAHDNTYASGHVLLVSHAIWGEGTSDSPTDVTFDNFVSAPAAPATVSFAAPEQNGTYP